MMGHVVSTWVVVTWHVGTHGRHIAGMAHNDNMS